MANDSPLSVQTTMPEYPNPTYDRWRKLYGHSSSRLGAAFNAWLLGNPNYNTWRQNQLDDWNAKMTMYNTWLQSGEGIAASAESGGYNKSYFDGGSSSASPLSYQDVDPGSGFSEMAQGIQGALSFASAVAGLKGMAIDMAAKVAGIKGQELKNKAQEIQNKWLDRNLNFKSMNLGYQADWSRMRNQAQIYSQFAGEKGIWDQNGMYAPSLGGERLEYFMPGTQKGFFYNRQNADLAFLRMGTQLREAQRDLAHVGKDGQRFYVDQLLPLQKQVLDGQIKLQNLEVEWKPIEYKLRKEAQRWGLSLQTANTVIGAIKTGLQLLNPGVGGLIGAGQFQGWSPSPSWSTPWSSPYNSETGEYMP